MTAAPAVQRLDIASFPFVGAQVIEASAGTGKTWTLAHLYLRLLLGAGPGGRPLQPPQILVMTFTEAATRELRDRIRRRVALAAACFRQEPPPPKEDYDPELLALRQSWSGDRWPALAWQLELAAQSMDEAAIHTLHGWCNRVLRQFAFDSGSLFRQDRLDDPAGLLAEAVRDYWRQHVYPLDAADATVLADFALSPAALQRCIARHLFQLDNQPHAAATLRAGAVDDLHAALQERLRWRRATQAQEAEVRRQCALHAQVLETQLHKAWNERVLSGSRWRAGSRERQLAGLLDWAQGAPLDVKTLERFGTRYLGESLAKGKAPLPDGTGCFALIQALVDRYAAAPEPAPLHAHAALAVHARMAVLKRQRARFDFGDLLHRVYHALQSPEGQLAARLRTAWPVAMVDEFQDTDRWQYGALQRIYLDAPPEQVALVMIGDPKQAIYGFRGADLGAYLEARAAARAVHTLADNYRSTPALVRALNHVYAQARERSPFEGIAYEPVEARRDLAPLPDPAGGEWPAVTVDVVDTSEPLRADRLRQLLARNCALQAARLVGHGQAKPQEIAILVRSGMDARALRAALLEQGLRSVYLSERDSVFRTPEARELWYLLRALTQPRSLPALRAALSTRLMAYALPELDRLLQDERALELQLERFAAWQQRWQRHGLLPMLYALLHEQQLPQRLLAQPQGERILTNLLHLGDLLQQASLGLQGESAVVRHLADQMAAQGTADAGTAQLRLETEEALVKVVTQHSAKGLQYPVVFVPFAHEFRVATDGDLVDDDARRIAEDQRLLYVAFTRAERALFIGCGTRSRDFAKTRPCRSAFGRLLGRSDATDLLQCLEQWTACPDIAVRLATTHAATAVPVAPSPPVQSRPALQPRRRHANRWRSSSFSSLAKSVDPLPSPLQVPDDDDRLRHEDAATDAASDTASDGTADAAADATAGTAAVSHGAGLKGGAALGDVLHRLLEWQLLADWPLVHDPEAAIADPRWAGHLRRSAAAVGLNDAEAVQLQSWVQAIGRCPLPLTPALTLAQIPAVRRWAEMGFVLPTAGLQTQQLDQCLQAAVLPGLPRDALRRDSLHGLLTGFMDLVFEHDGRYYVLDYKSNRLPDYGQPALEAAIVSKRYELQYMLYLLALHRLLKARLPGYDYGQHMGGAIYLFVRGIGQPGDGVYMHRPERGLIEQLDGLLSPARGGSPVEAA
ncbi:MAG: RecBCD enzyme subunit RecB [Pseudomonadota bacterium]